jgi:hypothetical protein
MEYKHTITVSKDAWFIRLYCWLWEARASDINICKLFWGYVFFLPGLLFYTLIVIPARRIDLWHYKRKSSEPIRPYVEPVKKEHPVMQRILGAISFSFAKVASIIGAFWYHISKYKKLNQFLAKALICIAAGISIVLIGVLLYVAAINVTITALILGGLIALFVAVVLALALDSIGFYSKAGRVIKTGGSGFFSVLFSGLKAVKSNTCPQVKVID